MNKHYLRQPRLRARKSTVRINFLDWGKIFVEWYEGGKNSPDFAGGQNKKQKL